MIYLHRGIVLRAPSPYRSAVVLLDEHYGKIEALASSFTKGPSLCHGALLSYVPQKRHIKYMLAQQTLLEMPLEWARQDFLFFHHVLELCAYFLPFEEPSNEVFQLVSVLYEEPGAFQSRAAQKTFLYQLFTCFGMYPDVTTSSLGGWFRGYLATQLQAESLRAASFLKVLDRYEDCS